jgi:cobalt-precorrin 5A hydrolase
VRKNKKRQSPRAPAGGTKGFYVFSFTRAGRALAKRLSAEFEGTSVARPFECKGAGLRKKIAALFKDNALDVVFIGATGIAVRTTAPFLRGKDKDPAVVVMDDAGRFVISLLSGHMGGANELARAIAGRLGSKAVITTATDAARLPALEDLACEFDLAIEDAKKIKAVNAAILNGDRVFVADVSTQRRKRMAKRFGKTPFTFRRAAKSSLAKGDALVVISDKRDLLLPRKIASRVAVLRPRDLFLGIGCRRGVSAGEIEKAVDLTLKRAGVSSLCIKRLATVDIKRDERGLLAFARKARLVIDFFSPKELSGIKPPSGESRYVKKWLGIGAVSEPSALKSSRTKRIWLKKEIHGRVTIAAARRAC